MCMHILFSIPGDILAKTYRYLQYEHQKMSMFILETLKTCMYLVYICKYLAVFLYVLCQYMHVLHVFARMNAISTFACLEHVQMHAIRANTDYNTCIYVHQIRTDISDCICTYMIIYACI